VQWLLLALDLDSGDVLWQREVHKGIPIIKRHTKSTHANATPATDGEHLAVMLGSEGLFVYDLDGNLLWKKDLGTLDSGFYQATTAQWGWASSPLVHDGRVIIQADVQGDSFLAAFDIETGDEIWRTAREEVPTWSTPTLAPSGDGFQIVVNGWKHIGSYDFESGRELWKMAGGGDIPVPTPVLSGDLVVITSAHGTERPIYAIRLDADGDIKDTEYVAWQHERAGNYMQTPIVVNGIGYFCLDSGILTAYEMKSGDLLYKQRLGSGKSGFSGSAVADSDKLFFTSEDGDTYVIATGREYRELAVNELGETFMSTPAITGNTLLMRGRSHLFAFAD
jgi:outer membrane protein assembly factor BamB